MDSSSLMKSGLKISRIGVGTAGFGMDYGFHQAKTQKQVDDILETCGRSGINFLDTARDYRGSEERIGGFLAKHAPSGLVVATKIARIDEETAKQPDRLRAHIEGSLQNSIKALQVKKIPILQLHQCDDFIIRQKAFWHVIEGLRRQGLIQAFGVSVYSIEETRRLIEDRGRDINVVQLPFNLFDQRFAPLLPWLKKRSVDVICRSVFLKGVIAVTEEKLPAELAGLKPYKKSLAELAGRLGVSAQVLALQFVLQHPEISSVIIGIDAVEELKANVAAGQNVDVVAGIMPDLQELGVEDPLLIDPRRWKSL